MLFDATSAEVQSFLPAVTRRRKIPGTREFDKARVFADISASDNPRTHYQEIFETSFIPSSKKQHAAGRIQKPNPRPLSFLYENPRFLNEPICFANSASTRSIQSQWWPPEWKDKPKPTPRFNKNTTFRTDYAPSLSMPRPNTRFGCNKSLDTYAVGICPVTDIRTAKTTREQISFEHQFDSRRERRERGKLHGSFVWQVEPFKDGRSKSSNLRDGSPHTNTTTGGGPHMDNFYTLQKSISPTNGTH